MPEYVELLSSQLVIQHWLSAMQQQSGENPLWQSIYVDTTIPEDSRKQSPPEVRAQDPFQIPLEAPAELPLKAWRKLAEVHFHPRNIILRFMVEGARPHDLWMRVQMLTHMVSQIYTEEEFKGICTVDKELRSKIALGLGFTVNLPHAQLGKKATKFFLVFSSLDLLFTITYASSREGLGVFPESIFFNFEVVLERIIRWATYHRGMNINRYVPLAMRVIRDTGTVFSGVGVYTISEVFYMAGLAPDLTEGEVFDNPSRFARLVEAYYSYAARAHKEIWLYVSPYLKGGYSLAIKNEHRTCYARRLYVYGKTNATMPLRLQTQFKELNKLIHSQDRLQCRWQLGYFDPFEPTYIQEGLKKPHNLGALIFSKGVWEQMGGTIWVNNPLTAYFKNLVPMRWRPKLPGDSLHLPDPLQDVMFSPKRTFLHASIVSDSKMVSTTYTLPSTYLNGKLYITDLNELTVRATSR
ncbi:hypothetical protein PLEOSDRAFT_1108191 [Pleurotus ostreatus PC15]|uniref:Uncharacterized protein n=1 Tax=Pleurotus ostreatus (strain PC15) TaxID=1137138 RepID=A0A067N9R2_PLEO1|nr:hypothetical protein PLEOSDRAFT_1108191 [Pleurotus ostreatus PC15]